MDRKNEKYHFKRSCASSWINNELTCCVLGEAKKVDKSLLKEANNSSYPSQVYTKRMATNLTPINIYNIILSYRRNCLAGESGQSGTSPIITPVLLLTRNRRPYNWLINFPQINCRDRPVMVDFFFIRPFHKSGSFRRRKSIARRFVAIAEIYSGLSPSNKM